MGAILLSDIKVGDTVETYIEGGWRVIDGKRVEKEHDKGRITGIFPHKMHGEYELAVILDGSAGYGLLRLSEVTRVIPASAAPNGDASHE
jgi:hypothetical protein